MDKNLEPYIKIIDKDISFNGDTPQEQELNKWLYHTTLELNRYQDMTKEVLDYILSKVEDKTAQDIYKIIKDRNC